jgi:hypothetical protein
MKKKLLIFINILLITGCTTKSITVHPIDSNKYHITEVCIERNNKVILKEFLPILVEALKFNNVKSKIYNGKVPNSCQYELKYVAYSRWDLYLYLKDAIIEIYTNKELIASAIFKGASGLNPAKRESTELKIKPVITKLLKGNTALKGKHIHPDMLKDKLIEIKSLYEDGLITDKEYNLKRKQILNKYYRIKKQLHRHSTLP